MSPEMCLWKFQGENTSHIMYYIMLCLSILGGNNSMLCVSLYENEQLLFFAEAFTAFGLFTPENNNNVHSYNCSNIVWAIHQVTSTYNSLIQTQHKKHLQIFDYIKIETFSTIKNCYRYIYRTLQFCQKYRDMIAWNCAVIVRPVIYYYFSLHFFLFFI